MKGFTLYNWVVSTLSVLIVGYLLPGVSISSVLVGFIVALVLGIINIFIRPVMILLTLPLTIVTLGLFTFVINGLLVLLTSSIVPGFAISGFFVAILFSLFVTFLNGVLLEIFKDFDRK